jgi:adenylate cyclase, class 2
VRPLAYGLEMPNLLTMRRFEFKQAAGSGQSLKILFDRQPPAARRLLSRRAVLRSGDGEEMQVNSNDFARAVAHDRLAANDLRNAGRAKSMSFARKIDFLGAPRTIQNGPSPKKCGGGCLSHRRIARGKPRLCRCSQCAPLGLVMFLAIGHPGRRPGATGLGLGYYRLPLWGTSDDVNTLCLISSVIRAALGRLVCFSTCFVSICFASAIARPACFRRFFLRSWLFCEQLRHELFHLSVEAGFGPQGTDDAGAIEQHRGGITEAVHVGQAGQKLSAGCVGIEVGGKRRPASMEKLFGLLFQLRHVVARLAAGNGDKRERRIAPVFVPQFQQMRKFHQTQAAPRTPEVNERDLAANRFQRDAFGDAGERLEFQELQPLPHARLIDGLLQLHVRPQIHDPQRDENRPDAHDNPSGQGRALLGGSVGIHNQSAENTEGQSSPVIVASFAGWLYSCCYLGLETMHFEVEQKFPLDDVAGVERRLRELGAREAGVSEQIDWYFNHPARDFAQTDEALRLRSVGAENFITYKGPKLDATTKTRHEIELPLAAGAAATGDFAKLLESLGFRPVGRVSKTRRRFLLQWQGKSVEAVIDQVAGLGQFMELEISASETEIEAAKSSIASLASALGLSCNERRSYLELLLDGGSKTIATSAPGGR